MGHHFNSSIVSGNDEEARGGDEEEMLNTDMYFMNNVSILVT